MSSDRIIADGVRVAQDLLRQNLPPVRNLTDAAVVLRFRELVHSQAIRSALERGSDTVLAFALREVERALCDQSRPHRETINRLWDILDDPLKEASTLGLVAELRRPCADLARQRSRSFFAPGSRAILGTRFPLAATRSRKRYRLPR
jgi:hypothetical protein